ncbi:glycosyltransferase family 4 protein [Desulfoscipio geothermicus]|uniref:Glycosyltransferase involved in cell wall bisynthesis n=1 Tax=Desulfoscipio geothermicus DSM 3669 TaxID=1121426 RepID=A0A1I6E944_9FIRM|nr:glycosyltransferase family 1 protein [Desulfoscipio geothermicus]SFR14250.1 Glycosyltransferase involved in cell wall bisynthesis [Desulfoscipio geothermicus DSM 3669]
MKKIYINARFLTQTITGVQRYAIELVKSLDALMDKGEVNINHYSFVLLAPRNIKNELHLKWIPLKYVGCLKGHLWEQLELPLYAHNGLLVNLCNVGPLLVRNQVLTIHDVFSIEYPHWVGRNFHHWYSFLLPRLAQRVRKILTVSEYSKRRIVEVLGVPSQKVQVVYNGIDNDFKPVDAKALQAVRQKYDLPDKFILTLGSLEPRKNLDGLVKAWLMMPVEYRKPLVIAGGLGARQVFGKYEIEFIKEKGLKLLGYVSDEDLPALYATAEVFVYVPFVEGFGLPPVEALACGARVVTSNTSAMLETCQGLAVLVNPTDIESISRGIVEALQTRLSLNEKLSQSEKIKKRFNWMHTAQQVQEVLERYI